MSERARGSFQRALRVTAVGSMVAIAVASFFTFALGARLVSDLTGQRVLGAVLLVVVGAPVAAMAVRSVIKQLNESDELAGVRQVRLDRERRHRELESQVADGLEMADNEREALRMIERSFAAVAPTAMVELLLADNSQAHLTRKAMAAPEGSVAGCGVGSPQECPAARRARIHRFADSDAMNACPKLAGRDEGRWCAVCLPVSVMGRTVGVIHTVRVFGQHIEEQTVEDLQTIASQAGGRLGMLRVMAETQLQASTDGLTGLMNRRAFENGFINVRDRSPNTAGVIVMADLDLFKSVNDTYGHETGDRALRVFADTLRRTLRTHDLVARRGGEEFTIAFPECDLPDAMEILERVRQNLQIAIREAGLPTFTASFGVTPAFVAEDLDILLARADAALFEAKRNGRDRVVVFTASDVDDTVERELLRAAASNNTEDTQTMLR